MYEKCLSFLADSEGLNGQCDYSFKLNMLLIKERAGGDDDARAWGVLTLCDLMGEISRLRDEVLVNSTGHNPFDMDLMLALRLPGEKMECDEIVWSVFSFDDVDDVGGKTVDIAKVRDRLEKSMGAIEKSNRFCSLDDIGRLSSIYGDVLAMLSRLSPRY
jgi:hypothetical protein